MHRRLLPFLLGGLLAAGLTPLLDAAPASATPTVHNVTTVDDVVDAGDGLLSLREAVTLAGSDGESEIVLQAGATYHLTICDPAAPEHANADGDLDLAPGAGTVTITGNGATIDQDCAGERVLLAKRALTVHDLTISGGDSVSAPTFGEQAGAGIYVWGDLTVEDSVFTDNHATTGASIYGDADVNLRRTVITGNTGTSGTGGVTSAGVDDTITVEDSLITDNTGGSSLAVVGVNDVVIRNTTITGNEMTVNSIYDAVLFGHHLLRLEHTTVVDNLVPNGATLYGPTTLEVAGSIVVNVGALPECHPDSGTVTTLGGNVLRDTTCGNAVTDHTGVTDPKLAPLGAHGGPTATQPPLTGSPALDTVAAADCLVTVPADQRGVTRPQGAGCDAGAVEATLLPDGVLRLGHGPLKGDGVRNLTGAHQTITAQVHRGATARFRLRLDNDGDLGDHLVVRGPHGRGQVLARYSIKGGENITTPVAGAGREFIVAAGHRAFVNVAVTVGPNAPHGLVRNFALRVTSTGGAQDRVVARVRVR